MALHVCACYNVWNLQIRQFHFQFVVFHTRRGKLEVNQIWNLMVSVKCRKHTTINTLLTTRYFGRKTSEGDLPRCRGSGLNHWTNFIDGDSWANDWLCVACIDNGGRWGSESWRDCYESTQCNCRTTVVLAWDGNVSDAIGLSYSIALDKFAVGHKRA